MPAANTVWLTPSFAQAFSKRKKFPYVVCMHTDHVVCTSGRAPTNGNRAKQTIYTQRILPSPPVLATSRPVFSAMTSLDVAHLGGQTWEGVPGLLQCSGAVTQAACLGPSLAALSSVLGATSSVSFGLQQQGGC